MPNATSVTPISAQSASVSGSGRPDRVRTEFSGGPVWETDADDVIGLLSACGAEDDAEDAYLLGLSVSPPPGWPGGYVTRERRSSPQEVADLQSGLKKQAEARDWLQVLATVRELRESDETLPTDPYLAELRDLARLELASHPPRLSQYIATGPLVFTGAARAHPHKS
jgi:hypothetical protein